MSSRLVGRIGAMENLVISTLRAQRLFSIHLTKQSSGDVIDAHFYVPVKKRFYIKQVRKWSQRWDCKLRLSLNKKTQTEVLPGADWLSSLLHAVEFVRRQMPDELDQVWTDSNGLPCWLALPRFVPTSWGYELYREITDANRKLEARFVAKIDKKRRAYMLKKNENIGKTKTKKGSASH